MLRGVLIDFSPKCDLERLPLSDMEQDDCVMCFHNGIHKAFGQISLKDLFCMTSQKI